MSTPAHCVNASGGTFAGSEAMNINENRWIEHEQEKGEVAEDSPSQFDFLLGVLSVALMVFVWWAVSR